MWSLVLGVERSAEGGVCCGSWLWCFLGVLWKFWTHKEEERILGWYAGCGVGYGSWEKVSAVVCKKLLSSPFL